MRSETAEVGGRSVRLWRGGQGPRLVLLQGGMADAELHWAPVWGRLSEAFEVIAPDWPGFGESSALPSPTWPAMLQWLDAFMVTCAGGCAHMVGNSFGATVARLYAAAHPDRVGRLALLNGGTMVSEATVEALRALPEDPAQLAHLGRRMFSREALERLFGDHSLLTSSFLTACSRNGIILSILRASAMGPQPEALTPSAPTWVLWGEADRQTHADMGRILAAAIPGASFFSYPALGHLPQLESPLAVADLLTYFLTEETWNL